MVTEQRLTAFLESHPAVREVFWALHPAGRENYRRIARSPDATGGMITGTVGQLVLAGPTSHTVAGTFPRVLVTGRYNLDGNVLLNNRLRIQGGRLRNTSFRVRVNNP